MKFSKGWMVIISLVLGAALMAAGCKKENNNTENPEYEKFNFVFTSGEEGYACYRVVSMVVTQQGTVLAFCEGRVNNCDDEGDIDLVMKRSTDNGETWSPLVTLENDGLNPCKNPCPVVLPSGRILLMWCWNKSIPSEKDRTTRDVYITYSDDDGLTWAPSRNITSMVYRDNWEWYGTGPCHGFVKEREPHAGRVIIPARHEEGRTSSHILYSDDNGETWHIGAIAFRDQTTECTAVELSNGDVMLNSRNANKEQLARVVHISSDGGETFDKMYLDTELPDAGACQGSILKHSFNETTGKMNLLFSNPNHPDLRVNGTLKWSEDDGENWSKSFRYSNPYPAFSGYSDIAIINGSDVAVLFESGPSYVKGNRYEGIAFKIIKTEQLTPIE